jgi:hypothetical protein
MPRYMSDDQKDKIKKMVREGETSRKIALVLGCGTGSVARIKKEMGIEVQTERYRHKTKKPNMKGGRPKNVSLLGVNPSPSPAALRLAQFDKVVARALNTTSPPSDDEE